MPGPGWPPAPVRRPPFPGVLWFLLLVLIGFVGQVGVFALGAGVAFALQQGKAPEPSADQLLQVMGLAGFMAILLVASLSWPVVALAAARIRGIFNRDTFRLRWPGLLSTGLSIPLGMGLVPVALLLENLMSRFMPRGENVLVTLMGKEPSTLTLALLGLTLVAAAPVGEELLFRGIGLRGIERRYGPLTGALIVSVIFAGVHFNVTGYAALFLVSVVLCRLTSLTGSLIPAMVLHAAYNGTQYLMMLAADFSKAEVEKALKSRELGIPFWMIGAGALLAAACFYGAVRTARTPPEQSNHPA